MIVYFFRALEGERDEGEEEQGEGDEPDRAAIWGVLRHLEWEG